MVDQHKDPRREHGQNAARIEAPTAGGGVLDTVEHARETPSGSCPTAIWGWLTMNTCGSARSSAAARPAVSWPCIR